jgi:hypothetical protein
MVTLRRGSLFLAAMMLVLSITSYAEAQRKKPPRRGGGRDPDLLKVGDNAPDFKLKTLDGKKTVSLSSFKGKQPVSLVFGSYT